MGNDMRKLIDQVKNFGKSKLNEGLNAKYQASELYKYTVRSKYIIGFESRENILCFETEEDAKNYINQKPSSREYLGLN